MTYTDLSKSDTAIIREALRVRMTRARQAASRARFDDKKQLKSEVMEIQELQEKLKHGQLRIIHL